MVRNNNHRLAVQNFRVNSACYTSKKNQIKLVLKAEKDEVTAGEGTVADVLVSLEFHSTGADSSPASVTLNGSPFDFRVDKFEVKQDLITVTLVTPEDEQQHEEVVTPEGEEQQEAAAQRTANANINTQILEALARQTATDAPVELVLISN